MRTVRPFLRPPRAAIPHQPTPDPKSAIGPAISRSDSPWRQVAPEARDEDESGLQDGDRGGPTATDIAHPIIETGDDERGRMQMTQSPGSFSGGRGWSGECPEMLPVLNALP